MSSTVIAQKRLKFRYLVPLALIPALIVIWAARQYAVQLDPYLRTFNLLGTVIHESGHSYLTLLTGGSVLEFVVRPDGSGYAMIAGGWSFLSLPAGYFATTLLTAVMFYVNNRTRWGEVIPFLLGLFIVYLTWRHGMPDENGNNTTIIAGYISAVVLIYIGIHPNIPIPRTNRHISLSTPVWMFIVNTVAMYIGLGGILSLQYLADNAMPGHHNDVVMFTEIYAPWMHPGHMAFIWMALSIAIWTFALFGTVRLFKKEKK